MLSLILVTLTAAAAGLAVWAADRHRDRYGVLLLPGIAVCAAILAWIAFQMAGAASFESAWIGWAVPAAVAVLAPLIAAVPIGRKRAAADTAEQDRILRL
mgnify:CR=1 FL=1